MVVFSLEFGVVVRVKEHGYKNNEKPTKSDLPGRFLDIDGYLLNALSTWVSNLLGLPKHPTM